jgi:hypothetical protein
MPEPALSPDASALAFTPEEASAWLRKASNETAQAVTLDAAVAPLREFLDSVAWWG